MKRIAILMGLFLLAAVEPALAQGARGGNYSASAARSVAGYTGGSIAGYTGASTARQDARPVPQHRPIPPGRQGHHHGRHHPHVSVVFPGWWYYPYGYRTVVVPAPIYVPEYVPVPAPAAPAPELRYYCPDYRDYYPNVATCPSQWLQVVPQALTTTSY